MGVRRWITARLVRFLTRPVGHYEQQVRNDLDQLEKQIRKGDVLLVEGDQRVSVLIKYLTRSSWSHAALYIGDDLLERGGELRESALERFGDEAKHLLVEALHEGVVFSPLSKYIDFNLRICRPYRLRTEDLEIILDEAIAAVGWRYDLRNILDLAIHLSLAMLLPHRYSWESQRFGSTAGTDVICTSLLGRIFHKVGFPVLPSVTFPEDHEPEVEVRRRSLFGLLRRRRRSCRGVFRRRHPTLLAPRDFDLSPYFEIVKFNVIGQRDFDYQQIEWAIDPAGGEGDESAVG